MRNNSADALHCSQIQQNLRLYSAYSRSAISSAHSSGCSRRNARPSFGSSSGGSIAIAANAQCHPPLTPPRRGLQGAQFPAKRLSRIWSYWLLCVAFWLLAIAPASASVLLRVAIIDGASQVKIASSTPAVVRDGAGRTLGEIANRTSYSVQSRGAQLAMDRWQTSQFWIEPKNGGYVYIGDRWYRGRTHLVVSNNTLSAINVVDIEQYLYSVLGAEMDSRWPQEALKAQAVAARTYALYHRERRGSNIYDLGDSQSWQVYKGVETEASSTYAAVDATSGQVLTYNGELIEAVFHSSSGGHTENVEDIWQDARPYLRGVPDYDAGTPVFQWTKTFSAAELRGLISGVGNIATLKPERTTQTGRIITMRAIGDAGERVISGDDLRYFLDLKSSRFSVQTNNGNFVINGFGFGHGVGMSQWGAYNLARRGANYQQILLYYYQNANLAIIQVDR